MKKPVQHVNEAHWDYHEVVDYIENKYDIQTRGYKKEVDGVYRDFWHWFIEDNSIHNGCYSNFDLVSFLEDDTDFTPDWVKEILQLLYDEFGEVEMNFWIEW